MLNNSKTQIEATLKKLHYNLKWLEYGFADPALLEGQMSQYESGSDESLEHYRFDAFRKVLTEISSLDDLTVNRYIELAKLDEDQTMAQAALGLLVKHQGLTMEQMRQMQTDKTFATKALQNIIEQTELLRALDTPNLTSELFERCASSGKSEVQRKLLRRPELSMEQLAALMDRGANKAIRNLARDKSRRITNTNRSS